MTNTRRVVGILLASGLSRRYGSVSKLLEVLEGKPVVRHAADVLATIEEIERIAVYPAFDQELEHALSGTFRLTPNHNPEAGMGHSIALAARAADPSRPASILVCLADMPFVPAIHLRRLIAGMASDPSLDMVHSGVQDPRPPAMFAASLHQELCTLSGDLGAGAIARRLRLTAKSVELPEPECMDIDTPEDLRRARFASSKHSP